MTPRSRIMRSTVVSPLFAMIFPGRVALIVFAAGCLLARTGAAFVHSLLPDMLREGAPPNDLATSDGLFNAAALENFNDEWAREYEADIGEMRMALTESEASRREAEERQARAQEAAKKKSDAERQHFEVRPRKKHGSARFQRRATLSLQFPAFPAPLFFVPFLPPPFGLPTLR